MTCFESLAAQPRRALWGGLLPIALCTGTQGIAMPRVMIRNNVGDTLYYRFFLLSRSGVFLSGACVAPEENTRSAKRAACMMAASMSFKYLSRDLVVAHNFLQQCSTPIIPFARSRFPLPVMSSEHKLTWCCPRNKKTKPGDATTCATYHVGIIGYESVGFIAHS